MGASGLAIEVRRGWNKRRMLEGEDDEGGEDGRGAVSRWRR